MDAAPAPATHRIVVAHDWQGHPLRPEAIAWLDLALEREHLCVAIEAPYHDDPPPPGAPGPCDRLWEYEVVELFLLGDDDRYLEVECSPHGHHLVLELHGRRRVVRRGLPLRYWCRQAGGRWWGEARIPRDRLPRGLRALNAYRIHGCGDARRHLAAHPVGGEVPDFHNLDAFGPWPFATARPAAARRTARERKKEERR